MKKLSVLQFSFLPLLILNNLWFQYVENNSTNRAFEDTIAVAQFSASPLSGDAPLLVTFTNLSENADGFSWDFGDGNTSSDVNPEHTFNEPGDFTITLIASNTNNSATETKIGYITVSQAAIEASFTADPYEGVLPLIVSFTNNSINAVNYSWNFGDGETSSEISPIHTYNQAGDYTVSLIAFNGNFSDTITKANYISVNEPKPIAEFSATPLEGIDPLNVTFTDKSENAQTWQWDFGDGMNSIEQNPLHTFGAGTYTVSLFVTNSSGSNSVTKENLIVVNPNGIYENLSEKVKIFPNPANKYITVELVNENYKQIEIEVLDISGRMVKKVSPFLNTTIKQNVDIQDLEAGNYLLKMHFDTETVVLSFTKE